MVAIVKRTKSPVLTALNKPLMVQNKLYTNGENALVGEEEAPDCGHRFRGVKDGNLAVSALGDR